mmetsp:Transcript_51280/g.69831  ORF Transcript_51280/g.69831 Transcript_51280/m.69831 type:complete len:122 (+) Transcript_51280:168-533(+)
MRCCRSKSQKRGIFCRHEDDDEDMKTVAVHFLQEVGVTSIREHGREGCLCKKCGVLRYANTGVVALNAENANGALGCVTMVLRALNVTTAHAPMLSSSRRSKQRIGSRPRRRRKSNSARRV